MSIDDAAKWADVLMMTMPDELQADTYRKYIHDNLRDGAAIAFAHGLNVHFGLIQPKPGVDVIMMAPKGPGHTVRGEFVKGGGVPCLVAVANDASRQRARDRQELLRRHRRRALGDHRDRLPPGVRDRPLRRAGGALRRAGRADPHGLRDAGRGRLRAGNGLFRVPARGEAHRGSDLRGRHRQHELLDLQHRRVRRVRLGPAHPAARGDQAPDEGGARGHPVGAGSSPASWPRTRSASPTSRRRGG